ncbi:hypothetical protein EUTSA_v10024004mg [Eutrema salsugineum]|uniref:F-box domain-containing protein n=1 Tax=Eutrema salsugineum TaxID=72664 RepID=V4KHX4_EUTSA|nr:putative F-box protein At3g22650 [Eutrema salsugineum]ESQ29462.1 hypothetical protein EUTSA_v10024004mg [Eutrema salsugineum]
MTSTKQSSSSLLPFELVEEILYKIPIESLVRFKSVCKEWYGLLSEKIFIYKHLDISNSKERFIFPDIDNIQLFDLETEALVRLPIPNEFHSRVYSKTIHCDGLLLFRTYGDTRGELAVWNPFLRRVKWIKQPLKSYPEVYGFGYDNVSRDNYKILRMCKERRRKFSTEIEIYEFKSKLWRSVDAALECNELLKPVSIYGNMYWIAQKDLKVNLGIEVFIQSFDFSTETFKPIHTECFRVSSDDEVVLSGFRRERLSLLHHNHVKIDFWVTNKVTDGTVSWSKYFSVSRLVPKLHTTFHCSFLSNKFKLWGKEDGPGINSIYVYVNVYKMGEGNINKQFEMRRRVIWYDLFRCDCHVYVPSLVPVPE